MKIGTTWEIKNYNLYINNGYGKIKQIDGQNYLQYKIAKNI
jgi:hypothetical protein